MTETKRFWILNTITEYSGITDKDKLLTFNEVLDLLNELHDENQLLHKINEDTINFMYDNFDSNIIFTDRELNDICNEMGWELLEKGIKIKQLEKENEQLKQQIGNLEHTRDFCAECCERLEKESEELKFEIRKVQRAYEQLWEHTYK